MLRPEGPLIDAEVAEFTARCSRHSLAAWADLSWICPRFPSSTAAGWKLCVDVSEELGRGGQTLRLCAANKTVREVLELTELASLFDLFRRCQHGRQELPVTDPKRTKIGEAARRGGRALAGAASASPGRAEGHRPHARRAAGRAGHDQRRDARPRAGQKPWRQRLPASPWLDRSRLAATHRRRKKPSGCWRFRCSRCAAR